MIEFITVKLKDISNIYNGKTPSTSDENNFGGDIPWITPKDLSILQTQYISKGERNISKQGFKAIGGIYLPKGTILLSSRAPIGLLSIASNPLTTNQGFKNIVCDSKKVDYLYLYYLLKTKISDIENLGTGTTFKEVSKSVLEEFSIKIHSNIKNQQSIANVLSTLDQKITINNQINAQLEQMAKMLYDYWFVQFDFPDENGKPYKSSGGEMVYNETLKREIPKGWEVKTLGELGEIVGGSTPSTANVHNFCTNGTAWITPNDLSKNQGNKFIGHGEIDVTDNGIKDANLKKYPSGTILMSSRAPIGYMAIARNEVTTNQGFKSFIPNKGYTKEFVFYAVKNSLKAIIQSSSGSTFKEVSSTTLRTIKTVLPNKDISNEYYRLVAKIFQEQDNLEKQNQQLIQLRDFLLPMLMNGQVGVGDG